MMPQKKNPDSLELVRGKTGRVYGGLVSLLTVMKGLPFSYGKDMQEDKEPLFDAVATLGACLRIMDGVIRGISFDTERMAASINDFAYATDIADYLTLKGMPFRQAHEVAGRMVKWSVENGVPFSEIPYAVFREHSELFGENVTAEFNLTRSTDRRNVTGGTGRDALLKQIERAGAALAQGV